MEVILLEDIKGVGKKGQLLKASDGHARNYLLPRKLAMEATPANLNELKLKNKAAENKKEKELQEAKDLGDIIAKQKLVIPVKMGNNGKLFGSVTNKEIAEELEKIINTKIDKKKIVLHDAIKTIGEKNVDVKLHPKVTANLVVEIIEKK